MSMNLGALVMRLVLEARQFRTEMSQATAQAEQEAAKLEGVTGRMQGAARAALASQGAAGRAAAGALQVVGPAATTAAAGIAVLAAGVAAAAVAYNQGSKEAQAYEKALILTGNASGTTAGQMADMARNIDLVVGTQAQAAAALAQMAGSGRVAGADLQKFTTTALEMERTVGTAVSDTVKQFAELGAAPVKASLALNETMNYLTASTYAQIKAAVELGDEERAASIAQNAYADAMGPRIAAIEQSLGTLERAWRGVKELAREAWDSMLNIGRPDSLATQMDNVRAKIAQAQGQDKNRPYSMPWDTPLADLQQQLSFLTEQERMIKRGTEAQTERNRVNKDAVEALDAVDKANERALTKQERANKALEEYRKNLAAIRLANDQNPSADLAAKLDPAVIARTEEAIRKSGESAARAVRVVATEQEKLAQAGEKLAASLTAQESGLSGDFAQKWAQLSAAYQLNGWSVDKLTEAQAALLEQQPAMKASVKAQADAAAALSKTMAEYEKAQAGGVAEAVRAADQAERQLAAYGMLESQVQELTLAHLEQSRELAALAGEDVTNIEKRIEAMKRLIAATRGMEERKTSDDAAKATAAEWQRTADTINQSLTDALLRGFESGKDFAANLRDTVVNMFKTMVLRPIVSFILSPISGALGGLFGMGGAVAGQGGTGSTLGTVASGASLFGSFGGAMAGGAGWLTGATTLGGSLSAGASLIGTGSMAGIGSGLGMLAGALGPIALGLSLLGGLFGRKLKDSGIEGSLGGDSGFEGRSYKFYKGGLLSSDKTIYDALDEQVRKTLGDTFKGMQAQVSGFADALELDASAIADFTTNIKVSTKGLSDADAQKALEQALATANNELAEQVLGTWTRTSEEVARQISASFTEMESGADAYRTITETVERSTYTASEYAKTGEKAIDTLTRLATSMTTVNAASDALGYGFHQASLAAASAASNIADAFGGLEAFSQTIGSYLTNFYSDAERKSATARQVARALGDAGLDIDPRQLENVTRPAIRAFVETIGAQFGFESKEYVTAVQQANVLATITEPVQQLTQTAAVFDSTANDAARAAEEARRAWQQITDSLLGTKAQLSIELLRAQGREEEALAAERQLATQGMDAYQTALWDANKGTQGLIDSLLKMREVSAQLASELPGVIAKFLTPEQNTANGYASIAGDLVKAGLSGADVGTLSKALAGASKAEIAQAAAAIYNMAGVTDEMRLALVRAAGGLADLKDAAVDATANGFEAAYQDLEKAVAARRQVLQGTVSDLKAVFDILRSNARALFGQVDSTQQMLASQGEAFVTQALAAARSTGYLPDAKQLGEAIDAVRGGLDSKQYTSQFDKDVARLAFANTLADLEGLTGKQLTEAERQLRALDDLLTANRALVDAARTQLDATYSGTAATLSIAEALDRLGAKLGGGGGGGGGGGKGGASTSSGVLNGPGGSQYVAASDTFYAGGTGLPYFGAALGAAAIDLVNAGKARELYDIATANGVTSAMLGKWTGTDPEVLNAWALANNLPAFANGGMHTGGLALVGERGPEIAYLPPARIYDAGQTRRMLSGPGANGSDPAVVAAIEKLAAEQRVQAAALTRLMSEFVKRQREWDEIGQPPVRPDEPAGAPA